MQKTTCSAMSLFWLFIFILLGSPLPAGAQIFNSQDSLQPGEVEQKVFDPLQSSNRKVFYFNDLLYTDIVEPVTVVYRKLPPPVRKVVRNGFQNLEAPSHAVNLALQGNSCLACAEVTRFVINSTVGVCGMFDVARDALGIQDHDADFGQTLGAWCVAPGPYLVVPALGPSDTRDLVGYAADSVMDPLFWIPGSTWVMYSVDFVKYTAKASDHIDQYETMKKASVDPYVAMRNAYMQHREDLIRNRPAADVQAAGNARLQAPDQAGETIAKTDALAQAHAQKPRKEITPRKNASARELAQALRKAAQDESSGTPLEEVLQQYPQLAGAVSARNAIAQNEAFRPDWGQDNKERLAIATEMICRAVARGDRFTGGRNDSKLDRIRQTACNEQKRHDSEQELESVKNLG